MKYVVENLCLFLLCSSMCGCAAIENRSALPSTLASLNCMFWQTSDINVAESKTTIWDHMPWATSKNCEGKKTASFISRAQVSNDSSRKDRGDEKKATEHTTGQAVQHVNWEPRIDQADRAFISESENHTIVSRLPTNSVWR